MKGAEKELLGMMEMFYTLVTSGLRAHPFHKTCGSVLFKVGAFCSVYILSPLRNIEMSVHQL